MFEIIVSFVAMNQTPLYIWRWRSKLSYAVNPVVV